MVVKLRAKPKRTLPSDTMSPFNFHAIQTLEILPEDKPNIDVQNGRLVLTASRGDDQIMITAPLNSVIPVATTTKVKTTRRARRQTSFNKTGDRRVGENHKLAKLTEEDVRSIRQLTSNPEYMKQFSSLYAVSKEIAKGLNVHFTTVMKIIEGRSWKHVQ
jgi:predicted 2-oxoglutarate/Fe(II)-dependent dioxygenase YbiX